MNILITGAAGCLGSRIVNALTELANTDLHDQSHDCLKESPLKIFATDIKENPFIDDSNLTYKRLDLRTEEFSQWLEKIRPDKIVHLASILQISKQMTREMAHDIDVVATKKLFEQSITLGVKKIIVTTSGAAYGYYPENKNVITEDRPTKGNNDYFYSAHKAEVEAIMAEYRETNPELKQVIFRPGAILGPDFQGPVVNLFQQKLIVGLMGYPGPFNFIWSEDIVDYITEALTTSVTGEFNIAGDGTLSMRDIAKCLHKPYLPLPPWLIQGALAIAKPLGLSQYGPEQVKFIKYRPVLSNEKIKRVFKHQPRYSSQKALDAFLALTQY
jgi:UDP-glucose 4-epimerase